MTDRCARASSIFRSPFICAVLLGVLGGGCGPTTLDPVFRPTMGPVDATTSEPPAVPTSNLEDGLLAHWPFDEGSGNVIGDVSGNHHDGSMTAGTWVTAGHVRGALALSRNQHIEIPSFPQATTTSLSVSLWARFKSSELAGTNRGTLISNQIPGGGWEVNAPSGGPGAPQMEFAYPHNGAGQDNWVHVPCCVPVTDTWIHFTAVFDARSRTVTVYDGENPRGTSPRPGATILMGSPALFIGAEVSELSSSNFQGTVDEIRIYDRVLTPADIHELDQAR